MSKFLFVPLSVAAVAVLAACGGRQPAPIVVVPPQQPVVMPPQQPAVTTVVAPPVAAAPAPAASAPPAPAVVHAVQLRPGMGRIESMGPAPSPSAGGTAASAMHRLNVRMDDGSMQVVDTPSTGLAVGDRVELTREGFIRRIPA
jgi:hypothetical protein